MDNRLTAQMISLGTPVAWDLCTQDGRVVFRKGFVINTESSLQRILNMELFLAPEGGAKDAARRGQTPTASAAVDLPDPETVDSAPFRRVDELAAELAQCYSSAAQDPRHIAEHISGMAAAARQLYYQHGAACLAAIHFHHDKALSCLHPIYSVFLVELVAQSLGFDRATHERLSTAALSANFGMFEFHDQWSNQDGPLNDVQFKQLRAHPQTSVERLSACGVSDAQWLQMIAQHHERSDGSGYPKGLFGYGVMREALVLGVIDYYLALVMPRGSRKMQHPTATLKKIHEDAALYDPYIISTMIQQLGVYPPGKSVRLVNGEIAVVTHPNAGASGLPQVTSVARAANDFLDEPIERDTRDPEFKIRRLYQPDLDKERNPATMVRSWT
jgi:hypothetical protein